jgi:uncharacterized protein YabN with tetrapyrrole methylase and pyrophosphatase domain
MQIDGIGSEGARALATLRMQCAMLPPETDDDMTITVNDEMFIDELVSDAELEKKLRAVVTRAKKNNVVFTLPGDAVGAYRTYKLKSEAQREAAVKHALTKYPNAVIL